MRIELDLDGRRSRLEERDAAVIHDGLKLIEILPWGESLRQILDGRLPWLPHRTNAEIARAFHVKRLNTDDQTTTLRLIRWEDPEDSATDLQATFPKATGLPILWEARFEGHVVSRLRLLPARRASIAGDRSRSLILAHNLLPATSSLRDNLVGRVLEELQDPKQAADAAALAGESNDPATQVRLLWHQVELSRRLKWQNAARLAGGRVKASRAA